MVTRAVGCGVTTILPSSPSHVSPSANIRHGHPTSDGDDFGRPTKRPRVNPLDIVKDVSPSRCHALLKGDAVQSKTASGKDEKAMMEDLMAGLDASVFENFETSPVKALWTTKPMRSPLKAKREVVSPSKTPKSPIQQTTPSTTRKSNAFRRTVSIQTDLKVEDLGATDFIFEKAASKNIIFEEDHFDFESDLADLSAFDDDLLLKPRSIDIRYPLINPLVPSPPPDYRPTPWARCVVSAVYDGLRFSDGVIPLAEASEAEQQAGTSFGKTLIVKLAKSGGKRVVHLRECWADLPIQTSKQSPSNEVQADFDLEDTINIVSPSLDDADTTKPIIVTFKDPSTFLIHHPDLMLTMTSIANAMPCPRKPLLQALVKPSGPSTKSMLYGTILHTLLQGALSEQGFAEADTWRRLDEDLSKEERKLEIWGAGLDIDDVRLELGEKAEKGFEVFGDKWVGPAPKSEGELHTVPGDKPSLLAITGLHDIEEDIWSPTWGLKGKVDASVQANIIRDPSSRQQAEEHVAPLEIKTGRSVGVMGHRAQTMLYTLLMEDRYGVRVPAGLLYYSQLDSILRVEAKPNEIRALIIARNELAHYLSKKRKLPGAVQDRPLADIELAAFLPPTIDHPRECSHCYAVDSCMLYRKAVDHVPQSIDDPIAELYKAKTGHLSEKDAAFFAKWDTLLTVEEQDIGRLRFQLWTINAAEREKTGRCFSDMVISSYTNDLGKSLAKIHRHTYTFVRAAQAGTQARNASLLSGHIAKGDPVSLSIEPDLLCLSRGFVTNLTASTITIGVTYVIDVDALLSRTQHRKRARTGEWNDQIVFRIDKDEMASGMMRMRSNLAQLFFAGGDETRRRLIVDLEAPRFDNTRALSLQDMLANLNENQRKAMNKVMTAKDYALILGMPGTGKTTIIAEIIKSLVDRGKSVLLTSYTHSAVDTILMKLLNADFPMLRLGNIDKVHPDVQHLTLEAFEGSATMAQLEARLMGPPVVAATCLSVDHPLFFRRKFDYCIVDEASQITLPTCLGPLRLADIFLLVGDHFQLPPIVRNPEARRGGLDVSLFRLLSEAHPDAVTDLTHQYRMHEDIMLLSNNLIYEGRLKCGSEQVAKQALVLRDRKPCTEIHGIAKCGEDCWVQALMQEEVKAVFVDTDLLPAFDSKVGDLVQNPTEAKVVYQLAKSLTSSGLKQSDLAVITPYRQQIKLLTGLFLDLPNVEILTADKSQGRDKECILISLVRSNEDGNIGDLLRDWRRINVSFTRAKKKLVIFGSRKTLQTDCLLAGFLRLMEEKGWIYLLPKGADEMHSRPPSLVGNEEVVKREKKAGRMGKGVLNGKPFAQEVMTEIA